MATVTDRTQDMDNDNSDDPHDNAKDAEWYEKADDDGPTVDPLGVMLLLAIGTLVLFGLSVIWLVS